MKTRKVILVPGLVVAFSCLLLAGTATGQMKLLVHNNFEKGTQKRERRGAGGVSIKSSKKDAANGKKSLWVKEGQRRILTGRSTECQQDAESRQKLQVHRIGKTRLRPTARRSKDDDAAGRQAVGPDRGGEHD